MRVQAQLPHYSQRHFFSHDLSWTFIVDPLQLTISIWEEFFLRVQEHLDIWAYNCQDIMPMGLINKNKMEQPQEYPLLLIKFEPHEVLFQQRDTRKVYRYFNITSSPPPPPHPHPSSLLPPSHPSLLRGTLYNGGVLYPKEQSDLSLQIEQRRRSFKAEHFSEQQIANTFTPLFGLLQQLHVKGINHGCVSLKNIVIVEGEVMLRDWLLGEGKYVSPQDDLLALGKCLLSCVFLTLDGTMADKEKQLHSSIEHFSRPFVIVLLIFAKQLKQYYSQAVNILQGDIKSIDSNLNDLYQALKPHPPSKPNFKISPKNSEHNEPLALSPMKKTMHKKVVHHQNIENKQGQSRRVRQGQKNVGSIQQLVSKKLNEQERRLKQQAVKIGKEKAVINLSNFGVQNNSRKLQKDSHSPLYKLRPYSKRK